MLGFFHHELYPRIRRWVVTGLCSLSIIAKLVILIEKGEGNVKETESTTSHPAIESPSIRPKCSALIKSASYIPNRDAFPDRGPAPPLRDLNDVDAFVKWVLGPPIEDWTEEQRASVHRHHSLHYHGVESCSCCFSSLFIFFDQVDWLYADTYPAVTLTPWVDTLPSPDSPEFEAAFNAGFYEEDT